MLEIPWRKSGSGGSGVLVAVGLRNILSTTTCLNATLGSAVAIIWSIVVCHHSCLVVQCSKILKLNRIYRLKD